MCRTSSPVVWSTRAMAEPLLRSLPLPLPSRSFISMLPRPTDFFDFASVILKVSGGFLQYFLFGWVDPEEFTKKETSVLYMIHKDLPEFFLLGAD